MVSRCGESCGLLTTLQASGARRPCLKPLRASHRPQCMGAGKRNNSRPREHTFRAPNAARAVLCTSFAACLFYRTDWQHQRQWYTTIWSISRYSSLPHSSNNKHIDLCNRVIGRLGKGTLIRITCNRALLTIPDTMSLEPNSSSGSEGEASRGSIGPLSSTNSSPGPVSPVEYPPSSIRLAWQLDVDVQELFSESRTGKIWRAAVHLSVANAGVSDGIAVCSWTDIADRASRNTFSHPGTQLVGIQTEKPNFGRAVSFLQACMRCWSGVLDFPSTSPHPIPRLTAQICMSGSLICVGYGPSHYTICHFGVTHTILDSSSCRHCERTGS